MIGARGRSDCHGTSHMRGDDDLLKPSITNSGVARYQAPFIPAQAGIQIKNWVPAFAGTSGMENRRL
jgi:hypothetical protein